MGLLFNDTRITVCCLIVITMSSKPPKKSCWKKWFSKFFRSPQTVNPSGPLVVAPPFKLPRPTTPNQPMPDPFALSPTARKWLGAAQDALKLLGSALDIVPIPGLGFVVTSASMALSQLEVAATNADDLKRLEKAVLGVRNVLSLDPERLHPLSKHINQRIQTMNLGFVESSAEKEISEGVFHSYFNARSNAGTIAALFERIQTELNDFMAKSVLNTEANVWDLLNHEEQKSLESSLQNVFPAQWDKLHRQVVGCMTGTRGDILDSIYQWCDTPDTEPICWLPGVAGFGKTAIAKSVCENTASSEHKLGGGFFCSRRGDTALRDVTRIFPSLAFQLCHNVPNFHRKLLSTWNGFATISNIPTAPAEQFMTLIVNPLLQCRKDGFSTTIVLVVDALDECDDSDAAKQFFQSMSSCITEVPRLKVFVTSRPETKVLTAVRGLAVSLRTPLSSRKNDDEKTNSELTLFFTKTLQKVDKEHRARGDPNSPDFPSDTLVASLVRKAQGSYLYASIVCNAVSEADLDYQEVANHFATVKLSDHVGLNPIYDPYDLVLQDSIKRFGNLPAQKELLYSILGAIIHLQTPLSISDLASLIDKPVRNVFNHLDRIRSILYVAENIESPEPVQAIHATLNDFLVAKDRENHKWTLPVIDPAEQHLKITLRTFELMNGLVRNPCGLDRFAFNPSSDIVSKHISGSLSYACQFWADHLTHCVVDTTTGHGLLNAIQQFAAAKLLVWIEACSLLGYANSVVRSLHVIFQNKSWTSQLGELQVPLSEKNISVLKLLQDAYRLVSTYSEPLHHHAAQLYLSAFKMLPTQSPIRHQYRLNISVHEGVEFQRGCRSNWDPCLHLLTIPDGKLVAVVTAASPVNYVGVLSRGKSIVTLRVWDMTEGSLKWSKKISDVQDVDKVGLYSSRGHFILVIKAKRMVTLFDYITGIASQKPDCFDVIRVIPGSGLYLKTSQGFVSVDSDVALPATSFPAPIQKSPGFYARDPALLEHVVAHIDKGFPWALNLGWSDCGRFLASCVRTDPDSEPDRLAVGWIPDEATQTKDVQIFAEFPPRPFVGSICSTVSHEEPNVPPRYAACAGDRVQIWCTKTRTLKAEFIGHHRQTDFITFSHDNRYIVTGAGDAVKVWDWQHDTSEDPMDDFDKDHDHELWLQSVSFSEDGKQFVSSSWDKSIVLWKEVENKPFLEFEPRFCPVQASFTPSGDIAYVLSVAYDGGGGEGYGFVTLWNPVDQSDTELSFSRRSYGFKFSPTPSNEVHHCVTRHENAVRYFQYTTKGDLKYNLVATFRPLPVDIAFSPAGTLALVHSRKLFLYNPSEATFENGSSKSIIHDTDSQSDKLRQYNYPDGKLYVARNRIFVHYPDSVEDAELVWVTVSDKGDGIVEELKPDRESKGFYMRDGWIVRGDGKVYAWTPRSYGRDICHDIQGNKLLLGDEDGQVRLLKIK